ncbi:hypothetical protein [Paraflavitalea sp. CAU 1676]|uniref:hypothetical protein n=1 Tax=Paraflavitalea sp. CAU 1676 TaxID=3032598 RepID=UPI0023DA7C59|nr:hypothetical protein [Paraflavitalea sp. CAU 1676]MDF2187298.1 hypothetical protein [Paraflavitalea sp. CAU 1676]
MKRWIVAGVTIASLAGYMACVKATAKQEIPVISKKLVSWESTGDSAATTRLAKDSLGRVVRVENESEVNTFQYKGDSLFISEYSKTESRIVYRFNGRVDSAGKLIGGRAIAAYGSFHPDTVGHRFEYNDRGYLSKEFRDYGEDGIYVIAYEYEGGDAVRISTWYNNELYNTKELEYYTDKHNQTGIEDFKFRRNVNNLAGHNSLHLVKKISSIARNGNLNYSFNYEYETDEEGLPVKLIAKKGKKVSTVTTYFYAAGT